MTFFKIAMPSPGLFQWKPPPSRSPTMEGSEDSFMSSVTACSQAEQNLHEQPDQRRRQKSQHRKGSTDSTDSSETLCCHNGASEPNNGETNKQGDK